jgi:hypothetical protein
LRAWASVTAGCFLLLASIKAQAGEPAVALGDEGRAMWITANLHAFTMPKKRILGHVNFYVKFVWHEMLKENRRSLNNIMNKNRVLNVL